MIIMYVRIEYQNKEYYSYVFAQFDCDYMPQYVVYDPIDEKFDIVALFSKKSYGNRQVGFMNESEKDFVRVNDIELDRGLVRKCAGYPWLIQNIELLKDIENGKPLDEKYVKIAKELNATIDPDAWNEVTNEEEAEDMMNHVGGFHDWYLIGMEAKSDPYDCNTDSIVTLRFNSQCAFDVLLQFYGAVYIKYNFYSANRIYLSSVILDNDKAYWVDGDEDLSINDIGNYDYILGNKMRWKFVMKEEHDW